MPLIKKRDDEDKYSVIIVIKNRTTGKAGARSVTYVSKKNNEQNIAEHFVPMLKRIEERARLRSLKSVKSKGDKR